MPDQNRARPQKNAEEYKSKSPVGAPNEVFPSELKKMQYETLYTQGTICVNGGLEPLLI